MTSRSDTGQDSDMTIKQSSTIAESTVQNKTGNVKSLAKLTGPDFEYWIRKDKVVVGRNSSLGKVDVNIESSSYVSRNHFQIIHERGRFLLTCLGKNGVFVNGQFQRLGANPLPLDKACLIRFPSTSIRLKFDPYPFDRDHSNGDSIQVPKDDASIALVSDQLKTTSSHLHVPTQLVYSKSVSPNPSQTNKDKQEFSSPSIKYLFSRDPRGFLSAPPSPTGTISAVNSCPSSPRGGTPHYVNQSNDVAENLKAAAIAASVLEKPDEKFSDAADAKPPYSYAQLIIQAISSAANRQLTLSGIYAHITKHYPYYRTADKGWQNSIRHNLSLNRYFVKVPRSQEESGKGSFWRVDPASERKLVEQAWRKRRQRAVPCFGSSLPSSMSNMTRSAPVSPERSNPASPTSALRSVSSSQENLQTPTLPSENDAKVQLLQFTTRYAQSAPGSPAGLGPGMVVAPIGDRPTLSSHSTGQHRAAVLAPASTLPLSEVNSSKVMWSLHTISGPGPAVTNTVTQSQLHAVPVKQDRASSDSNIKASTAAISTSKVAPIVQVPGSTASLTAIASFAPSQQRQYLQQGQSIPQQVVMMSGQPQRMSQAIPINVGTLVANPGGLMAPGLPFVVPMNQQYVVKRVGEGPSETHGKKAKTEDSCSGGLSGDVKTSE